MVDAAQKKVLDKHYGKCKLGSKEEEKIKQIYRDIGLKEKREAWREEESYQTIMGLKGSCKASAWAVFEAKA